ncbi:MAG: cell division protein FtsA [Bacteroidales bacterium]|nr:cell division protein FtsA [Bacteroidales bacterium]
MEAKRVTAIDIGTTKIVALTGEITEDNKVEVVDMGVYNSMGVERGIVQNAERTSVAIRKALEQIQHNASEIQEVWVGIAGQHVRSMMTSYKLDFENAQHVVRIDDLEKLFERCYQINTNPGEMVVHVAPQNFLTLDQRRLQNPIGKKTNFLSGNFHLTIAQKSAYDNIKKSLEINHIKAKELVLESIASAKSVLTQEDIEEGIALIDIGGGTSDIAIFNKGEVVHSAVIPFGGEVITADIMAAFNIERRYAEALKHEFGTVLHSSSNSEVISLKDALGEKIKINQKDLTLVIKARMEEIIDLIKFQFELSGYAEQLARGIVLTGGGALLQDLRQLFAFHFSRFSIRIGKPNKQFFLGPIHQSLNDPIFSTATGLLLYGIEMEQREEQQKAREEDTIQSEKIEEADRQRVPKTPFFDVVRKKVQDMFKEEDNEL